MKKLYYIQNPVSSNQFMDTREIIIEVPYPYRDYISFLAEYYEAEDEFWKEFFEDRVAEDAIMELKENF